MLPNPPERVTRDRPNGFRTKTPNRHFEFDEGVRGSERSQWDTSATGYFSVLMYS